MITVATVFQDHMVLQRERSVPVWGTAEPGVRVTVALKGAPGTAAAVAGADGRWSVALPTGKAGGPYELVVDTPKDRLVLSDVLVGEVWVCSGQSNMEWSVAVSNKPEEELAAARFPAIRMLNVEKNATMQPKTALKGAWRVCSPETVGSFSAVGYFFARELHRHLGVPIGMINSSWGGTVAEAWTSREGLLAEPSLHPFVKSLDDALSDGGLRTREAYDKALEAYNRKFIPQDPGNEGFAKGWAAPETDTAAWRTMVLPQGWQQAGENYSGVLWFRREVDVPAAWAGKDLALNVGACDKDDITYFNNVQVGSLGMKDRPDAWCTPRAYTVPGRLVRAGRNVIAVRVHSNMYQGGMTGPATVMAVAPVGAPADASIRLAGEWRFQTEHNFGFVSVNPPPPPPGEGNPNTPTALHNGMLAPVAPYGIRGAIWYQGESNAGRPTEYRTLFPAMICDWRRVWSQGDFPFYFVQLANYMPVREQPAESQWAELREAQRATLALPQTGMAVIIDIGEANDIHPRNKQDVGRRLALIALANIHGQSSVPWSGPVPSSVRRQGSRVRISFEHIGGGLIARDGALKGFAIADEDRVFEWASGQIVGGDTVVLQGDKVRDPRWVRYAWADNPVCNLYNEAGLPASPFESAVGR